MLGVSFATLFAASLTTASSASTPKCPVIQQNANFDDIQGSSAISARPPLNYKGLHFQGFAVVTEVDANIAPGVRAHSPPNIGAVSAETQTLQGTAMMTTNYAGSNTSSFSLQSFYFGLSVQLENGAIGPPAPGNLEVTGYRGLDNQVSAAQPVCSNQFSYNPSTISGPQEMASSGSILNCNDINFAIITFSPIGGLSAAALTYALVMDDIKFSEKGLNC